jgi:hypothetical protein
MEKTKFSNRHPAPQSPNSSVVMPKRFASIWFRHLLTDWKAIRQPGLKGKAYVFAEPDHGRMLITALTGEARKYGVTEGHDRRRCAGHCTGAPGF